MFSVKSLLLGSMFKQLIYPKCLLGAKRHVRAFIHEDAAAGSESGGMELD